MSHSAGMSSQSQWPLLPVSLLVLMFYIPILLTFRFIVRSSIPLNFLVGGGEGVAGGVPNSIPLITHPT